MTTILEEGNKLNPDILVELLEFDTTPVGGIVIFYLTNSKVGNSPLTWKGNIYKEFPYKMSGIITNAEGSALPRPKLSVSNVNRSFMVPLLALGTLEGCIVRRTKTFYKFTDSGTEPNILSHYPQEEYIVVQKSKQNGKEIQLVLSTAADQPGLQLPKRTILRDLGFPGVSRIRVRS